MAKEKEYLRRGELDSLDFLSRHPLPAIENYDTETVSKAVITKEHAVVLYRIRKETSQDRVLRKLIQTIQNRNWESRKRDADIIPFYQVKEELYGSQGMIFHKKRIILPANLQQKIIKTVHTLGHLGMTKTNQILCRKCCFPSMNLLNSQIRGSGSCFDCPLRTKDKSALSHRLFLKKHGNISVLISDDLTPMVIKI